MTLFGASGHCRVVVDILFSKGVKIDQIIDDQPSVEEILGITVEKNTVTNFQQEVIISIGDNYARKIISLRYPFSYQTAVHPSAAISVFSKIGAGTVVMAQATVNPGAEIGQHCIINTGAVVEHDCKIGNFVHVSPNASLAGNVEVEEGAHIGIGASVIQGIKIGKWAVVGAGTVVIKDVPDFATVVGNPGKIIKINNHNRYLNE